MTEQPTTQDAEQAVDQILEGLLAIGVLEDAGKGKRAAGPTAGLVFNMLFGFGVPINLEYLADFDASCGLTPYGAESAADFLVALGVFRAPASGALAPGRYAQPMADTLAAMGLEPRPERLRTARPPAPR